MIIVMKPKASQQSIHAVTNYIENSGLQVHLSQGEEVTIIGIVGDKTRISTENLIIFKDVDRIVPVTESYKLSNRKFHPEDTVIPVGNTRKPDYHGRSLCGGDQRAAIRDCKGGQSIRRNHLTGRRLQTPYLTLLFSGP